MSCRKALAAMPVALVAMAGAVDAQVPTDFFSLQPCRVIDTRAPDGPLGGPELVAGADRVFPVAGTCGIPPEARALSVSIAVSGATAPGNLRLHPGGSTVPLISSINYSAGRTRSNNVIVSLNGSGELAAFVGGASGTVHLILDVNGYFLYPCDNCPGAGLPTAVVGCVNDACTFACSGENYDVDDTAANGCEVADAPLGNHTQAAAIDLGSRDCFDASTLSWSGYLPNDARTHVSPPVAGFSAVTGSAPDFARVFLEGGTFCTNDIALQLQVLDGGEAAPCYQLTVMTSQLTAFCTAAAGGSCSISRGSGSYSDDTNAILKVERLCSTVNTLRGQYSVTGHF